MKKKAAKMARVNSDQRFLRSADGGVGRGDSVHGLKGFVKVWYSQRSMVWLSSWAPRVRCLYCNMQGHIKRFCRVKYCGGYRSYGHSWQSCPSLGQYNGRRAFQNFGSSCKKVPQTGFLRGSCDQRALSKDRSVAKENWMGVSCGIGLLGEPSGSKPVVKGSVLGINVRVFMDTGASINLMNYELFRSMFSDRSLRPAKETVCDVQANRLWVLGYVTVDLSLGGRNFI